ncbi:LuxR family transcriptional regulator [Saccharopolyspora shandongensis]|uniref:LuxR family transcriptional regulator n=1 Tax=Saccharopolyspora shandongensis TaxID=418495 RepID=UPI0034111826
MQRQVPAEVQSGDTAMIGRAAEVALLGSALRGVRETGAALLLRGDPGVGKSALLDWAEEYARQAGFRVLRAVGVETESELAFAALHQVLYPLLDRVESLPAVQQAALNRAFGADENAAPDRCALSSAALALVSQAAETQPVLLVVDDEQWIDASSAQVLDFIQRRVCALPVVFLAAVRVGWRNALDLAGIRTVEVAPLTPPESAALLARAHPDLGPAAVQRILAEAAGNPLALVEMPARLNQRQQRGIDPLPSSLPLGERLEAIFAGRLGSLPEVTRSGLLLAALAGGGAGGLRTVRAAAQGREDWDEQSLQVAESSGLITVDPEREEIVFRHPLVRSALVRMTPPTVRRAAHRALAEVLAEDPMRRAWHLADAADGPDESAAQALEHAAARALNCGGAAEAAAALSRAADLSGDPLNRARRLVEAAVVAVQGGQMDVAERLLEACESEALPVDPLRRATAAAFLMFHRDGDLEGVQRTVASALDGISAGERPDSVVDDALFVLVRACLGLSRADRWEPVSRALDKGSPCARLAYDATADPARTAHTVAERLRATFADLPPDLPSWQARWLILAAVHIDAFSDFADVWRGLTLRSAYAVQQMAAAASFYDAYLHGRWDEVEAIAEEGIERASFNGDRFQVHVMHYAAALVAASRGNDERLAVLNTESADWARPRRLNLLLGMVAETNARAAVTRGAYEEAYTYLSALTPPGVLPPFFPNFHRVFLDLVEACVRTGRIAEARAHVMAGRQARMDAISSHHALILAGSAALAAEDESADRLFQHALELPQAEQWPFEQARIQLAYGQWLRRRHDRSRARIHLSRALTTFRCLKTEPWAKTAAEELRVIGVAQGVDLADGRSALTAHELRIAELAAQGMTNKEIGRQLHLSPRTVGAHLYKIFPKLGVASRHALRDALAGEPESR